MSMPMNKNVQMFLESFFPIPTFFLLNSIIQTNKALSRDYSKYKCLVRVWLTIKEGKKDKIGKNHNK